MRINNMRTHCQEKDEKYPMIIAGQDRPQAEQPIDIGIEIK
jgi:hypothetical protein